MADAPHQDEDDEWEKAFIAPEVAPDALEDLARSQLEHALDARRRRLKIYESLKSLNDVIGTQYGDRVIFELLQNAHDAHPAPDPHLDLAGELTAKAIRKGFGEISIRLLIESDERGELLIANRGRGFSFSNLDAIRNIGTSDKEIGEGIGNKGLGFRSVEALTDDVHVFSQREAVSADRFDGYCFRFATVAEIEHRLGDLNAPPGVRRKVASTIPRYLVALPVDEQPEAVLKFAREGYATVVSLPLRSPEAVKLARKQVTALTNSAAPTLLFLERIAAVHIDIEEAGVKTVDRTLRRVAVPLKRASVLPGCTLQRVELGPDEHFLVARRVLPKQEVLASVQNSLSAAPPLKRWLQWKGEAIVSVAVPIKGETVSAPRLFNFLPMDAKTSAPMGGHIDAPFFADIDRTSLKLELPLNTYLLQAAATTCAAAAVTIVEYQLAVSENGVVDLVTWEAPHTSKIRDGFEAIGRILAKAEIWPIVSGGSHRWGSLEKLTAWPEVATKFLTPGRLAQMLEAAILPSTLGPLRITRLKGLASAVGLTITPSTAKMSTWAAGVAAQLAKAPRWSPRHWSQLYDDLVLLFTGLWNPLKELEGKLILMGSDSQLCAARTNGTGEHAPVFVRTQPRRGRAVGSPPAPPSVLSRRLRFLHEGISLSETTLAAFEKAGLVRRYDAVEILASIGGALSAEPTPTQRREALVWAFKVWRSVGAAAEPALAKARLHVPTGSGWSPAPEAFFSATWTQAGKLLEPYLFEAALVSLDCAAHRDRLLKPYPEWPLASTEDKKGDWLRFLELLKVQDGLRPVAGALKRQGTPTHYWHPLFSSGKASLGLDADWVAVAQLESLDRPQTAYTMVGECWRIPGQLEHEQLAQTAKEALAELLIAYLRDRGDADFMFSVPHWKNAEDSAHLPTPLAIFLKNGAWVTCVRRDEILLRRPDASWSTQVPRQIPPRFVERFAAEPGSRSQAPALLFDPRIGLRDWASTESAGARLRALADALVDLSAAERRDLRDQLRRAWSDLASAGSALPPDVPLVVERLGGLEVCEGSRKAPPILHITAERHSFAARALVDRGEAVLDVGDADANAIQKLIAGTGRFVAKLADAGDIRLLVDGVEFAPSGNDPFLVGGDVDWLADAAMLAHEFLGDALELRNLPPDAVEQKLRQVRLRRCTNFALSISGTQILARGRERIQAFPHARLPTLIVAAEGELDLDLLIEAAPAISKLIGVRRDTLETMLSRLERSGFQVSGRRPSDDQYARAIQRDAAVVRDHFAATDGSIDRRVRTLIPIIAYIRGRDAADLLAERHHQLGPALKLEHLVDELVGTEEAVRALAAIAQSDDQAQLRRALGFDFGRYNDLLVELGYPPLNDEQDFRLRFEVYLNELRPNLLERVRRRYHRAYLRGESLAAYAANRSLPFIVFDPKWVQSMEELDRQFVQDYALRTAEAILGPDDLSVELPDLQATTSANQKLLIASHSQAARLVRAWCRKNERERPPLMDPADPQPLVRAIEQAGLLDFERIGPKMLPALYAGVDAWPEAMEPSLIPEANELSEDDLDFEEKEAREARRKAEIARRTIMFGGAPIVAGEPDFERSFAQLAEAALARGSGWYARSRPPRLQLQDQRQPSSPSGSRGGGKGSGWRDQPPEPIRRAMGAASEYLAREYLRRRHPREMSDECWVSSNRAAFCSGSEGNDSLGYDFRVVTTRNEWLYEVKSALDEGGEFELSARELEVAGSAATDRKRRYRILYVPFVFDPDRWRVLPLQNPVGEATRNRFKLIRSGSVRYGFEIR